MEKILNISQQIACYEVFDISRQVTFVVKFSTLVGRRRLILTAAHFNWTFEISHMRYSCQVGLVWAIK